MKQSKEGPLKFLIRTLTPDQLDAVKVCLEFETHQAKQQAKREALEECIEFVQENRKGTFTDDAGYDCWYIDELVKALTALSIQSIIKLQEESK